MDMVTLWLIIAAAFLVIEIISIALTSVWFTCGAVVAAIIAAVGGPIWLQIVLFLAVAVLLFVFLYPRAQHMISDSRQATNADSVIGCTCRVTQAIDNIAGTGAVYVGGKTWTARAENNELIDEGTLVCVARIDGVKLIVFPVNQT